MRTFTKEDVLEKAKENNVKFIRLQFTDILGYFKNIAVTVEELPAALEGRVMFDSSVIEGFVRNNESDIYLVPDPTTFVVFPWRPREGAVARLICDIHNPDGKSFGSCSREILKRVVREAAGAGYNLRVAAEIEFYLFRADEQGRPGLDTHDRAGYCDLTPVDRGENARRDMVLTLQEMGLDVSTSHHEIGPGQHEIFLKDDYALATADNIATFKFVVRTIAQRHGLHASFMPRPLCGENGSGMHLHQSLWQGDKNAFDGPSGHLGLSDEMRYYMGGVIKHAGAVTAITNPLVNSYKRLVPTNLAPILAAWSEQNRSTMIRVPAGRGEDSRLVLRSPDPTCNPYLALAVTLKAGLEGITGRIEPPGPMEQNYLSAEAIRDLARHQGLPRNLEAAVLALAGDETIGKTLGDHLCSRFLRIKEEEWDRYQASVHQWELDEYLTNY